MGELALVLNGQQHMRRTTATSDEHRIAVSGFFGPAGIVVKLSTGKGGNRHVGKPHIAVKTLLQFNTESNYPENRN